MPRTPKIKELINTRLASGYGGWIYCESCGKNIGYLCYITYDSFSLSYKCKCGGCGSMYIAFEDDSNSLVSDNKLITIKNRLCCPTDQSPLFTILDKNLVNYNYEVVCKACNATFKEEKTV
jgi:uncharacterized protein YbaR (Trm112 family)